MMKRTEKALESARNPDDTPGKTPEIPGKTLRNGRPLALARHAKKRLN
jgi:hypothetical protein